MGRVRILILLALAWGLVAAHPTPHPSAGSQKLPRETLAPKHKASAKPKPVLKHKQTKLTRQKRLEQLEAEKTDRTVRPRHWLMALLAAALVALGLKARSDRKRQLAQDAPVSLGPVYQPRPVVLKAGGPDPHTYGEPTKLDKPGVPGTVPLGADGFRVPPSVAALKEASAAPDVREDEGAVLPDMPRSLQAMAAQAKPQPQASQDLAASLPSGHFAAAPDARPAAAPAPVPRPVPALRLAVATNSTPNPADAGWMPEPLQAHFRCEPGETLVQVAPFELPFVSSGMVVLTSQRLLAVVERHAPKIFPPGLETQIRRHQIAIKDIEHYGIGRTRRPSFLVGAGLLFLWYPAGTIVASLLIGLFFALPRLETEITAGGTARSYPLRRGEQDDIFKALDKLTDKRSDDSAMRDRR